jgi:hypothetical protein
LRGGRSRGRFRDVWEQAVTRDCRVLREVRCFRDKFGRRVIPEEADDFGNVKDERRGVVAFPVADGHGVYADLVRNLLLEESKV